MRIAPPTSASFHLASRGFRMATRRRDRFCWTMSCCADGQRAAGGSGLVLCGLLSCTLVAACFDVERVAVPRPPPPLEIDDFEDGDDVPSSNLFATWHCENSPGPT